VLDISKVNDDYCDCPDGSDEPGTGACSKGFFYCENKGHIPGYLPANRVNDGNCDYEVCCDGSDEWKLGLCPNKCKEVHAEYLKIKEKENKLLAEGLRAKQELIDQAAAARLQVEQEINNKEKQLEEKKNLQNVYQMELDSALREDEELQKNDPTSQIPETILDAKKLLLEAHQEEELLRSRIIKLEADYKQLDKVLELLRENYNPNFNDPAVKGAIREWEEIAGNRQDQTIEHKVGAQEVLLKLEEYEPEAPRANSWLPEIFQDKLDEFSDWLVSQGILARKRRRSNESSKVKSSRSALEGVERDINNLLTSIADLKSDLTGDYGDKDVLRALKEVCMKNKIAEYDYEVCFYKKASQNGNGHHSNLGQFDNWHRKDGNFIMNFENGARCWNGPIRRAVVELSCGPSHQILSVSEPEKCEYHIKGVSPVVCEEQPGHGIVHEDL
jgi:protein kinase C substrate 80K-H